MASDVLCKQRTGNGPPLERGCPARDCDTAEAGFESTRAVAHNPGAGGDIRATTRGLAAPRTVYNIRRLWLNEEVSS